MSMTDKYDSASVEQAHERVSKLEPRVEEIEDWVNAKDKTLDKIKNWIIGGVILYGIQTFGVWPFIKGIFL